MPPNPSLKRRRATARRLAREAPVVYPAPRGPGAAPLRAAQLERQASEELPLWIEALLSSQTAERPRELRVGHFLPSVGAISVAGALRGQKGWSFKHVFGQAGLGTVPVAHKFNQSVG